MGLIYALFYDVRQPRLVITVVSGHKLLVPSSRVKESKNHRKMEFVFILLTHFFLHQAFSTSYVVRATSEKLCLHAGNVKFKTQVEE